MCNSVPVFCVGQDCKTVFVKVEACCSALDSPSHASATPGHCSIAVPTVCPLPVPPPFFPRIVQPRDPGILSVSAGMRKCCNAPLSLSSLAGGLVPVEGSR